MTKETQKNPIWTHFKLFKKTSWLEITAVNSSTQQELAMTYALYDIDIVDRWINLINENNQRNNKLRSDYHKMYTDGEILELFDKFRKNISYINSHYDRKLADIVSVEYLRKNPNILNDLHEEYEIYGDRLESLLNKGYFDSPEIHSEYDDLWPGKTHDTITHECFLLLNEQIHNFEAIHRSHEDKTSMSCLCLADFIPAELHSELKPEDYLLFTPDQEWGHAYLGYNTLGKHWSSTMYDNDIDVVRRGAVRPQQRFAAEIFMNFFMPYLSQSRVEFYKWWTENNLSELHDPKMKLEEFAFGFIPVAKLARYRINSVTTLIPLTMSREEQNQWNSEVWSKFDSIKSIRIVNDETGNICRTKN